MAERIGRIYGTTNADAGTTNAVYGTTNAGYGTTNADAGVGIGLFGGIQKFN